MVYIKDPFHEPLYFCLRNSIPFRILRAISALCPCNFLRRYRLVSVHIYLCTFRGKHIAIIKVSGLIFRNVESFEGNGGNVLVIFLSVSSSFPFLPRQRMLLHNGVRIPWRKWFIQTDTGSVIVKICLGKGPNLFRFINASFHPSIQHHRDISTPLHKYTNNSVLASRRRYVWLFDLKNDSKTALFLSPTFMCKLKKDRYRKSKGILENDM